MIGAWLSLGLCCQVLALMPDGQLATVCHGQRTCEAEWGTWEEWAIDADRSHLTLTIHMTHDEHLARVAGDGWTLLDIPRVQEWEASLSGKRLLLYRVGGRLPVRTFTRQEEKR